MARSKNRKIKYPHLLGSKWTATQSLLGWRHYVVLNRQDQKGVVFAELQSVCQPNVKMWINARSLKNGDLWRSGWLAIEEESLEGEEAGAGEGFGHKEPQPREEWAPSGV